MRDKADESANFWRARSATNSLLVHRAAPPRLCHLEPHAVQTPVANVTTKPPSILKSLALAVGTLTLSTWVLGTLWMQSSAAETSLHINPPANPAVVASNAP